MNNKRAWGLAQLRGRKNGASPPAHEGRETKDESYLLRKRAHRASPARSTPPNINERRKTKVHHFSMPTKTTKSTKSLVVVLRFCSKLRDRGKRPFVRRSPRPPCTLLAGAARHTRRVRSCTGREKRAQRKKKQRRPQERNARKSLCPRCLRKSGAKDYLIPRKGIFLTNHITQE